MLRGLASIFLYSFAFCVLLQESPTPERPASAAAERGGGHHAHPEATAAQEAGVRPGRQVDGGAAAGQRSGRRPVAEECQKQK